MQSSRIQLNEILQLISYHVPEIAAITYCNISHSYMGQTAGVSGSKPLSKLPVIFFHFSVKLTAPLSRDICWKTFSLHSEHLEQDRGYKNTEKGFKGTGEDYTDILSLLHGYRPLRR